MVEQNNNTSNCEEIRKTLFRIGMEYPRSEELYEQAKVLMLEELLLEFHD